MRHSIAKRYDFGWSVDYAARVRERAHHAENVLPVWRPQLLGIAHQVRGWANIIVGALSSNTRRRGLGNRQRLVGILQRSGRVDRRVVQEFVDRWTSGSEQASVAAAAGHKAIRAESANVDSARTGIHFW